MVTYLYRIYEVKEKIENIADINDEGHFTGLFSSYSKLFNEEICEDVYSCDDRDQFKEYIRDIWGKEIPFKASKKLPIGSRYCVILGECWNPEDHFTLVKGECACCHSKIESRHFRPIKLSDWTIKQELFNLESEYKDKIFCSSKCMYDFTNVEKHKLQLELGDDVNTDLYVTKSMFHRDDIGGYIYKISKRSTGEFYIGQTQELPIFRWGQHLKTNRFPTDNITDYIFEVLEIVPKGKNILDIEKEYVQENYKQNPEKSLNISNTKNIDYREKLWE